MVVTSERNWFFQPNYKEIRFREMDALVSHINIDIIIAKQAWRIAFEFSSSRNSHENPRNEIQLLINDSG